MSKWRSVFYFDTKTEYNTYRYPFSFFYKYFLYETVIDYRRCLFFLYLLEVQKEPSVKLTTRMWHEIVARRRLRKDA